MCIRDRYRAAKSGNPALSLLKTGNKGKTVHVTGIAGGTAFLFFYVSGLNEGNFVIATSTALGIIQLLNSVIFGTNTLHCLFKCVLLISSL